MSRLLFALLAVLLAGLPMLSRDASAQSIAIVNIQTIMQKSLAAQSAREQLKAKQQQFQDEIKARESTLKKEDQELSKEQSLLAPEAFQQKVNAFRTKAASVQKDAQTKRGQLTKAFDMALVQLQESVVEIIKEIAAEKNFAIAVPSTQTLYYQPSLDITDEVLARLNKKLTRITINFQK